MVKLRTVFVCCCCFFWKVRAKVNIRHQCGRFAGWIETRGLVKRETKFWSPSQQMAGLPSGPLEKDLNAQVKIQLTFSTPKIWRFVDVMSPLSNSNADRLKKYVAFFLSLNRFNEIETDKCHWKVERRRRKEERCFDIEVFRWVLFWCSP